MNNQLIQLTIIQFKEFLRAPGILFWGILFPILMAWGLGMAFTEKTEAVRHVAVISPIDTGKLKNLIENKTTYTGLSRQGNETYEIAIDNKKVGSTKFVFHICEWDEAIVMLKRGIITMILQSKNGQIEHHFDPLNPEGQLIHLQLTALFGHQNLMTDSGQIKPLTLKGTRYIDFLLPGLIGMGVMMSCMWGISYSLIEKRHNKLLRRMVATPMKKTNFLISIFISRLTLNLVESGILLMFVMLYFDIRVQGSWLALLIIYIAGNVAFTGMAILVSSRTSKTEIGNGLINAIVTPMMILSGIFFSYQNFPDWSIGIIKLFPLTIYADSLRAVFIEGVGLHSVVTGTLVLCGIGITTFLAGLKIYKWY